MDTINIWQVIGYGSVAGSGGLAAVGFGAGWGLSSNANSQNDQVALVSLAGGLVAFQYRFAGVTLNAFVTANLANQNGRVTAAAPDGPSGQPGPDQSFQIVVTGDGKFAIYLPSQGSYITIYPYADPDYGGVYPLTIAGPVTDVAQAARFYANGINRPVPLDLLTLTKNVPGIDFSGLRLMSMDLSGYDFQNCNLQDVLFGGSTLSNANLQGASITGTNFVQVDFTDAKLQNLNFEKSFLGATTFARANLTGSNLLGQDLSVSSGTILSGAIMNGATLYTANLTGQDLTSVTLPIPLTPNAFYAPTLAGVTLLASQLGLQWQGLTLTSVTIQNIPSSLTSLNAAGLIWPNGSFQNCNLSQANFAGATLDGANFGDATLDNVNFQGSTLTGAMFNGASLNKTNFAGAQMAATNLTACNLTEASFVGATLGGVTGTKAATLALTFVTNCDFTAANLFGVDFDNATLFGGSNKLNGSANLQQANFANSFMINADFSGAILSGTNFDNACMVGVNLNNANFSAVEGALASSLTSAFLQGAQFEGTNLAGANLQLANITNTAGTLQVQFYYEGILTQPLPQNYGAEPLPNAQAFSNDTICPNQLTYAENVSQGLSIAQMLVVPNQPTNWSPPIRAERQT